MVDYLGTEIEGRPLSKEMYAFKFCMLSFVLWSRRMSGGHKIVAYTYFIDSRYILRFK